MIDFLEITIIILKRKLNLLFASLIDKGRGHRAGYTRPTSERGRCSMYVYCSMYYLYENIKKSHLLSVHLKMTHHSFCATLFLQRVKGEKSCIN